MTGKTDNSVFARLVTGTSLRAGKYFRVPALTFAGLAFFGVPAFSAAGNGNAKPYNPVEALREGRPEKDKGNFGLPKKLRDDSVSFSVAPEYFFDFGSDLPDATGWGASIAAAAVFDSATPKWDFIGELEFLAFSAESGHYTSKGHDVKESLQSANILLNLGLSREFSEKFVFDALLGIGFGATYGEIKGPQFKTSSHGNWTTTFSLKLRGEYRLSEYWSVFSAYRFAYISPSFASKIADWHNLDLFSSSVELGVRLRF